MNRRCLSLLLVAFFMFLYIGPVNLLPYDVPSAIIVQQPQDTKDEPELQDSFLIADEYEISVVLAADINDDTWYSTDSGDTWGHATGYTTVQTKNYSATFYYFQNRFELPIPLGAVVTSANWSLWEVYDSYVKNCEIRRIDEVDVGSLEGDSVRPIWSNITVYGFTTDGDGPDEWLKLDVTELVNEQVNLGGWSSGEHIGLICGYNETTAGGLSTWEDYQNTFSNNSYLNISYTYDATPYGEDWLTGWGRRQQHNISQTAGTGANYTVPMYVWDGIGGSWLDNAFTNGYAQDDFDDIRWTGNNGSTELEYQLNATWEEETTDYISNDSEDFGAYPVNYPSSFYYNQRTYISRQGFERDPYVAYYDHENETWSGWTRYGDNSALHGADDSHGAPCLFVDNEGYIHVFYGAHNTVIYHSKSDFPETLGPWTAQTNVDFGAGGSSYPHLFYDATNDVLHCYVRLVGGEGAGTYPLHYRNSTDKGLTWSSGQNIVEGDSYFPYTGPAEMDPTNTSLHIGWNRYTSANTSYQDVYYIEFNFTTGTVYNVSGSDLGEMVTYGEIDYCRVYDSSQSNVWGPSIHLDSDTDPYLTWICGDNPGEGSGKVMFSYWTGSAWSNVDNITETWVWVGGSDFIIHDSANITAFLSESTAVSRNMTKYTWDGDTWTRVEAIVQGGSTRFQGYNSVPMHYNDEIQIVWTEYVPNDTDIKMYAYGSDGLVQYTSAKRALFYVRVPDNLTDGDATIYLYYGNSAVSTTENATMTIDTGNDPDHDKWGAEEILYYTPVNYKAPTFDNPDDTDNMYARYKEYNFTMYVSDQNGYANIDFLKLGFWDDGRSNNYARWRYDSPENTFVEEYDWDDYFQLNLTKSEATKSGNYINCTFVFIVDWSCPDMTDVHIAVTAYDNNTLYDVDDHHFLTWDVETRLDFTTGPTLNDGLGTVDRGDYDTLDGITASGTVDYYGSAISPDSAEVDVWVSCSDVEGGPWSNTSIVDGAFSVTVDSDNVVGLDTYSFIVVEKGEGVGGSDLSHTSHSDTYIADRLIIEIQADDETPFNDQQVNFTLTIIYDYDDTVCSTYIIDVSRNAVWWHTFINGNKTLFNDTNSDVAYAYTTYDISESTHVLTKYSSGSESVTWSGEATTTTTTTFPTTPVTETGIFYDLFLSLEMWGYLGPLGLVIGGYVIASKNKGLGVIYYLVECLIAAQYFALIETTPAYWWHAIIILLGGLFGCVAPLMDKR